MQALKTVGSGLAGAIAVNLINEGARRIFPNAPRLDRVGENALTKLVRAAGGTPPKGDKLYYWALAGDVLANTMYYSLAGQGKRNWTRGALLGTAAGLGGMILPAVLGVDDPANRKPEARGLTFIWYLLGGIAAAAVADALSKR